jgi:hypothetical protein
MQLLAPEVSELQTSVYQFGPLAAVEILHPHPETEIKKNWLLHQLLGLTNPRRMRWA